MGAYPLINGQTGPYPIQGLAERQRGNYGRNAAYNHEVVARFRPDMALNATVAYSPQGAPRLADAFGYAEQQIYHFDTDNSQTLDQAEFTRAFGLDAQLPRYLAGMLARTHNAKNSGNPMSDYTARVQGHLAAREIAAQADRLFKVLDTDDNRQIDPVELSAYVLFSDDSVNLFPMVVKAMADGGLIPQQMVGQVKGLIADAGRNLPPALLNQPRRADGQITALENRMAELAITSMPVAVKETLNQFKAPDALDLPNAYRRFKAPPAPGGGLHHVA